MNNLSERVQREFNEWKEKYEIPSHMEFEVKTLLKLQEEYDKIEESSNTTLTRKTILEMIQRIHRDMRLKEKEIEMKPMYIDCVRLESQEDSQRGKLKIIAYLNNQIIILDHKTHLNSRDYAKSICDLAKSNQSKVYIDAHGFGITIYNELISFKNLQVEKLHITNHY